MCLAIPMKIKKIDGNIAIGEVFNVERNVDISLVPDIKIDDRVIVHAGFAIEKLDIKEAMELEESWKEYINILETE